MPAAVKPPDVDPKALPTRLARLRRRQRFIVTVRGLGWLLTAVLVGALVAGLLDWRWHLPGLVRAVFLVGTLSAAGYLFYRHLFLPLLDRADDLTLALRVEERYPALNDSLASTVQFLEQPEDSDQLGSPSLRREAVRRALRRSEGYDFNRVIDARGVRKAAAAALLLGALAVVLVLLSPALAWTALVRLAVPFGGAEWPRQTQLEIDPVRSQMGRNEPFEVKGRVRGVIPEKAQVAFRFEGQGPLEQSADVTRGDGEDFGKFATALKPGHVQKSFSFQVRANDAVSEWVPVTVLPPPLLAPRDGRASPQVHLQYPAYTDLPELDLPDGTGNVEAVAGTAVTLRAAADRPLARAWVEYQPESKQTVPALMAGLFGARNVLGLCMLAAGGQEVWAPVPAELESDPHNFTVRFLPRVGGTYLLHFQDQTGLHNSRLFELHVLPDPAPTVNLERPSPSRDTLDMLPGAVFTLQATADDPQYAVRTVALEYRCKKSDPPRRFLLYDHRAASAGTAQAMAALAPTPVPLVPHPVPFRLPQVAVTRRIALAQFRHLDPAAPELKEGDVLTIQAIADDFDDVTVDKAPGRSHEIEIRIIGRNALDILLNKEQAKVQEELVFLRQQEREALKKVAEAEAHWKKTGKLAPEDLDALHQAEQLQQQIRERVGPTRQEGVRAQVDRILQTLRDNQVPRSAAHERMEAVAAELNRLAREELEQVEQRLTDVRKEQENQADKVEATRKGQQELTEARRHQEEVEKTLNDLLARLEPWTSTREVKGEAKAILQEQKQLNQETQDLARQAGVLGKDPEQLSEAQQNELKHLQQAQQKLKERMAQLMDKMQRVAQERKDKDPETARELAEAHEVGKNANITGQMQEAGRKLEKNNLNDASDAQKEGVKQLEKLVNKLEDRREAELERLVKKLREAEKKLAELADEQERLQKKAQELQQKIKDASTPEEKEQLQEQLKKLGREQQKLQQEAQEMVKQLSRMRAERASQALGKAGGQMEQAGQQLRQGDNAQEQQEEALDRLDEAQRELQRAREDAEEELAREQLAKVAELLKRLKERQEGHNAELTRIQEEVLRRKTWPRTLLESLSDLARAQEGLASETEGVADKNLSEALVFAKVLRKAADAMSEASKRMLERQKKLIEMQKQSKKPPDDTAPDEEAVRLQQEAVRRLDQLLEALKPDEGVPQRQAGGKNGGGGEGGDGGGAGGAGDDIPALAQLKLVRAMQADVNKKTEAFGKQHPDLAQLDDKGKAELRTLHREQREIAELLEELTRPDEPEGGKP